MTKDKILTELARTRFVENYARKFCGKADLLNYEDIVGELWLIICEKDEGQVLGWYAHGGMRGVCRVVSGIIHRQLRSKSSAIYVKYTRRVYHEQPRGNILERCLSIERDTEGNE